MTDAELDTAIRAILDRYTVARHSNASHKASLAAVRPVNLYAVWSKGTGRVPGTAEQLIEPTTHKEAQEARTGLIAADILELVRGEVEA